MDQGEDQVDGTKTEPDCKTGQSSLHHHSKDKYDRNQSGEDVEVENEEEKEEEADWVEEEEEKEGECGPTEVSREKSD